MELLRTQFPVSSLYPIRTKNMSTIRLRKALLRYTQQRVQSYFVISMIFHSVTETSLNRQLPSSSLLASTWQRSLCS